MTKCFSTPKPAKILGILLSHISEAEPKEKSGKLVNLRDLPDGQPHDKAFVPKAVQPTSDTFSEEPMKLIDASKIFGSFSRNFGDFSIEISSLAQIPLVYILIVECEFQASANVLFDEPASCHLPTEDLAVLAESTTKQLLYANGIAE